MTGARAAWITICGLIAVASLGVAIQAARYAHSDAARGPTSAEISTAGATAIAQRWERLPLGQIFPATFRYPTDQQTIETAKRQGIGTGDSCAGALDTTLQSAARLNGCVAAVRATYADELGGTVYTVGVLAFPADAPALVFAGQVPQHQYPATGLHALALPGTPAALFSDQARQTSVVQVSGTYGVFAVAGYADGRPASSAMQPRDSVFLPASQLVNTIAQALGAPQQVHCGTPEFAC